MPVVVVLLFRQNSPVLTHRAPRTPSKAYFVTSNFVTKMKHSCLSVKFGLFALKQNIVGLISSKMRIMFCACVSVLIAQTIIYQVYDDNLTLTQAIIGKVLVKTKQKIN